MGELWVSYEIEFIHEKLNVDVGEDYMRYNMLLPTTAFANFSAAVVQSSYNLAVANNGNLYLGSLPPGQYQVYIIIYGPITLVGSSITYARAAGTVIYNQNTASSVVINNTTFGITLAAAFTIN